MGIITPLSLIPLKKTKKYKMKSFQIIKFLQQYNIDYLTEGHSRCTRGWVQLKHCPFCGADDYHLGINIQEGWGNCWKCRGKNIIQVIQKILKCNWSEAYQIHSQYEGRTKKHQLWTKSFKSETQWPIDCHALQKKHKQYLISRKYDPNWLEKTYDLKGTGHMGSYKFKIIAPIYKNGKMISFQGRDITNKNPLRYKTCSQDKETEDHKKNLYAIDLVPRNNVVVVEGITECWRLGPGSVATFGIGYTDSQVQLLTRHFKNIFILFDNSHIAQKSATKLGWVISCCGIHVEILNIEDLSDPAEMKQEDANYLIKHLCIN